MVKCIEHTSGDIYRGKSCSISRIAFKAMEDVSILDMDDPFEIDSFTTKYFLTLQHDLMDFHAKHYQKTDGKI